LKRLARVWVFAQSGPASVSAMPWRWVLPPRSGVDLVEPHFARRGHHCVDAGQARVAQLSEQSRHSQCFSCKFLPDSLRECRQRHFEADEHGRDLRCAQFTGVDDHGRGGVVGAEHFHVDRAASGLELLDDDFALRCVRGGEACCGDHFFQVVRVCEDDLRHGTGDLEVEVGGDDEVAVATHRAVPHRRDHPRVRGEQGRNPGRPRV
jgi:hypothetical protein